MANNELVEKKVRQTGNDLLNGIKFSLSKNDVAEAKKRYAELAQWARSTVSLGKEKPTDDAALIKLKRLRRELPPKLLVMATQAFTKRRIKI